MVALCQAIFPLFPKIYRMKTIGIDLFPTGYDELNYHNYTPETIENDKSCLHF